MTLINASLLVGVILAGLPVLLHLIMRAKPKKIEFPALRLLQSRQTSNSRRMRVRHLLLLILRALLIAVAVLALTRPSLPAAGYGLRWYEWLALIAVAGAAFGFYQWRARKVAAEEPAPHLQRERRDRLKSWSVLGAVLACLLVVGLPWGMRVYGEVTAPRSALSPDVPVAAVFVFDTSLSMTYKHESQTRLEQAVEMSLQHLSQLPASSQVAVATTEVDSEPIFQPDLAGVRSRIEDLKATALPRTMNAVVRQAIDTQVFTREQLKTETGTEDSFVREIYLLTDMSEASWNNPDESGLRDLLTQHDWLRIYIIDVSVSNPNNISLTQLRLDREATVGGQSVQVSATVTATPAASPTTSVEVFMISSDGEEIAGGGIEGSPRQRVEFAGSPPAVNFSVLGDPGADFQRGFVRLTTPDPMPFDDIRYFTFGVSPVPRVLLVGDRELDTRYVEQALQPDLAERRGIKRYECKSVTAAGFARETLKSYDIICINNWNNPDENAWIELREFVSDGGSLFVSTGGEQLLSSASWSTPEAEKVLPGIPLVPDPFRTEQGRQLNVVADSHPVCRLFVNDTDIQTLLSFALFDKCWTFELHPDTRPLMQFNDRYRRPALMERSVGRGKVLLFASAMDNNGPNSEKWNESFVDNVAFIILMDQAMQYLTGATEIRRNFSVGELVAIDVPAAKRFSQYAVARPDNRNTPGTFPFDEESILLDDIDDAGHYQLRSLDEGISFVTDFAANDIDRESNLTIMTDESLSAILGEDRFSRVTDPEQLDRAVNLGRIGVEVFPVLMGLLIVLFCLEHLMANFFYDEEPEPKDVRRATA